MQATTNPESLRLYFHQEIDRMEASGLEILNRMLQELKLFQLAEELNQDFDSDRAMGKLSPEAVAEAIRAARRKHPYA